MNKLIVLLSIAVSLCLSATEAGQWTAGRLEEKIVVDGKLDEFAWQTALWGGSFIVHSSFDLANKETEAAFLWDDQGLYVGVRAWETELAAGSGGTTVRDQGIFTNDRIEFFLKQGDAYRQYVVNSLGTQYDSQGKDSSADWRWEAACGTADGNRREFEVFLPWEATGLSGSAGEVFQFILARYAKSADELSIWCPWFGGFHDAPQLFPQMTLGKNLSGNLKVEPVGLRSTPAVFAFAEVENIAADAYGLRIVREDGTELDLGFHRVTEKVALPADLPPGRHFLSFSVVCGGEVVYTQRLPWVVEVPKSVPEVPPFTAELVQPWFETEGEVVLEYTNHGGFPQAEWRIADADGTVLSQGAETLAAGGRLVFPLPEAIGDYVLLLNVSGKELRLEFTRAEVLGEPRRWFAVGPGGVFLKDGKEKCFPLIYYAIEWDDLRYAKNLAPDLVISGSDHWSRVKGPDPVVVERNLGCLNLCKSLDLPVALMICNDFRRGEDDFASLRYAVARLKNHPALAAWYLADEPALYQTDPAVLEKAAAIIHEIDPLHPIIGCEVKTGKFKTYQGAFDCFGVDPYPGFPGGDLGKVDDFITVMQRDVPPDKFQFVILQGFGKPFNDRHPNRDETFNMTLQVLASGVDGICWWMIGFIKEEPAAYREMAEMVHFLKPYLIEGQCKTIRQGSVVIGVRPGMVVAVNKAAVPARATLPVGPTSKAWKQLGNVSLYGTKLELGPHGGAIWLLK